MSAKTSHLQAVPGSKPAAITGIAEHHRNQIRREHLALLGSVERGEIIGFGYTIIMHDHSLRSGTAGTLSHNRMEAAGAMLQAAVSSAFNEITR